MAHLFPHYLPLLPCLAFVLAPACSSSSSPPPSGGSSSTSSSGVTFDGGSSSGSSSGGSSSGSGSGSSSGTAGSSSGSSGSDGGGSGSSSGTDGGSTGSSSGTSGSSSGGTMVPCTFTASGAVTNSGSCMVNAAYDSSKGGVAFTVTDTASSFTFTFGATLMGQTMLADGTYTLADAAPGAGAEYVVLPNQAWMMCTTMQNCNAAMGGGTVPPQGSFTLTITDPGPVVAGVLWQHPQGTMTVIMPAQPMGPASGTVTVTVTL